MKTLSFTIQIFECTSCQTTFKQEGSPLYNHAMKKGHNKFFKTKRRITYIEDEKIRRGN